TSGTSPAHTALASQESRSTSTLTRSPPGMLRTGIYGVEHAPERPGKAGAGARRWVWGDGGGGAGGDEGDLQDAERIPRGTRPGRRGGQGVHARARGPGALRHGRRVREAGPGRRGRHLLRQVNDLPGRGRAG